MKIIIRKAVATDLEQIRVVFHEAVKAFHPTHYTENQVRQWSAAHSDVAFWHSRLANDQLLVAENIGHEIMGFSSMQADGCINMLYVRPRMQKKGIAGRLLQAIYAKADERYLPQLYTEASLASTQFFEKNGFQVCNALVRDINGVAFTKIQLRKRMWV